MRFRFRYQDPEGRSCEIDTVEELTARIKAGEVSESTLLYDALSGEWTPARFHGIFHLLKDGPIGQMPQAQEGKPLSMVRDPGPGSGDSSPGDGASGSASATPAQGSLDPAPATPPPSPPETDPSTVRPPSAGETARAAAGAPSPGAAPPAERATPAAPAAPRTPAAEPSRPQAAEPSGPPPRTTVRPGGEDPAAPSPGASIRPDGPGGGSGDLPDFQVTVSDDPLPGRSTEETVQALLRQKEREQHDGSGPDRLPHFVERVDMTGGLASRGEGPPAAAAPPPRSPRRTRAAAPVAAQPERPTGPGLDAVPTGQEGGGGAGATRPTPRAAGSAPGTPPRQEHEPSPVAGGSDEAWDAVDLALGRGAHLDAVAGAAPEVPEAAPEPEPGRRGAREARAGVPDPAPRPTAAVEAAAPSGPALPPAAGPPPGAPAAPPPAPPGDPNAVPFRVEPTTMGGRDGRGRRDGTTEPAPTGAAEPGPASARGSRAIPEAWARERRRSRRALWLRGGMAAAVLGAVAFAGWAFVGEAAVSAAPAALRVAPGLMFRVLQSGDEGDPQAAAVAVVLAGAESTAFEDMIAAMDSLRRLHRVDAVPKAWLEGRYLAGASEHPEVRDYWSRYLGFLRYLEENDHALFRRSYVERLGEEGIGGAMVSIRLARAMSDFESSSSLRDRVYHNMRVLGTSAVSLHQLLVERQADIRYEPVTEDGVSWDPVVEAVPTDPELERRMWALLDRIFFSLEQIHGATPGSRTDLTERILDGIRATGSGSPDLAARG